MPCFASQPGIRPTLFCFILYLCTSISWTLNSSLFKNCLKMCNGLNQYVVTILSKQQENTKINKFSLSKLLKILFLVKNYELLIWLFQYKSNNTAHLTFCKLTLMFVGPQKCLKYVCLYNGRRCCVYSTKLVQKLTTHLKFEITKAHNQSACS